MDWFNAGLLAGASPCGGEKKAPWGQEDRSNSCCGRTGPSAGGRG